MKTVLNLSLPASLSILLAGLLVYNSMHPNTTYAQPHKLNKKNEQGASKDISLNQLELEMAKSRYKLSKSEETRLALVVAYEKAIGETCLKNLLRNLRHDPDSISPECAELVKKTLKLYPQDPVAICARDGYDSDSCQEGFENQVFQRLSDKIDSSRIPDLELKLDGMRAKRLTDMRSKLTRAIWKFKTKDSLESREEAAKIAQELLNESCKVVRITYQPADKVCRNCLKNKEKKRDPLGILITGRNKHDNQPVAENKELLARVVSVSGHCRDDVKKALEIDPYFPYAVCVEQTTLSPACLQAFRKWNDRSMPIMKKGIRPTPVRKKVGFERF